MYKKERQIKIEIDKALHLTAYQTKATTVENQVTSSSLLMENWITVGQELQIPAKSAKLSLQFMQVLYPRFEAQLYFVLMFEGIHWLFIFIYFVSAVNIC